MTYLFDFMYCIICEQMRHVDTDGFHIRPHEHTNKDVCYGPLAWSEPPDVPLQNVTNLVAPDDEFMVISDANAESLLLEFENGL